MRYKIRGIEIRSENAAKPAAQCSEYLCAYLHSLPHHRRSLDFGCGKLRYSDILVQTSDAVTLVDSEVQLSRVQMLRGIRTSVYDYTPRRWPHATVLTPEQFASMRNRHDFALCANVLSAIPSRVARSRALRTILRSVGSQGICLFVSQYRNSYFKNLSASGRVMMHLDGWIVPVRGCAAYYGLLTKDKLCRILLSHGFSIREAWTHGQSAYVLAGT
jgi:Methyltransferase domain